MEYILTELLKNAFRATVEHHDPRGEGTPIPDVLITLSPPSAAGSGGQKHFSIRIRDQGGGVSPANMERIFSYAFTTAKGEDSRNKKRTWEDDDSTDEPFLGVVTGRTLRTGKGTIAGLGYGLPMSALYTK